MFTGIIKDLGTVKKVTTEELTVITKFDKINIGESIAVNGTCLTVTQFSKKTTPEFTVEISTETLKRTNLGLIKENDRVNLELPLNLESFLSGHIVTGHIDTVGDIVSIISEKKSKIFTFACDKIWEKYLVSKGSIAIDGISLTVVDVYWRLSKVYFTVAVIPFTMKYTNLGLRKPNDRVNIEFDILGKYVVKLLSSHKKSKIDYTLLKKTGFM